MVRVLKPIKSTWDHPKNWGMFTTLYKQKRLAEKHAERLKRDYGYQVAIVKTPKGWNVCTKITKKSMTILRKEVSRKKAGLFKAW